MKEHMHKQKNLNENNYFNNMAINYSKLRMLYFFGYYINLQYWKVFR